MSGELIFEELDTLNIVLLHVVGVYVPLTTEGNIVVDGVLTSCYPSASHELSHIGMTPIQIFSEIIEWIFGEHNCSPGYAIISEGLARWIIPDGQLA